MSDIIKQIARVALGFARTNAGKLIEFVRNVITLMTGNANSTTPSPTLATDSTAVDQFESLVQEASNGDRIAIAARNEARAGLLSLVRQLASYVQGQCKGDLASLSLPGSRRSSKSRPPSSRWCRRICGSPRANSGALLFRFGRGRNVSNFSIQVADDSDGPWTDRGLSNRTRVLLDGLTPLRNKWARARANGAAGSSDWTEPTCRVVI
ncbi:MAG: hypothetical protein ABIR29_14360 [Chthoniobacterales bacterium]